MDDELVKFTEAMLDEDEANAPDIHRMPGCGCVDRDGDFDPNPKYCGCGYPARVRREVAAKRTVLEAYRNAAAEQAQQEAQDGRADIGIRATVTALRFALLALAQAWNDHPGYAAVRP